MDYVNEAYQSCNAIAYLAMRNYALCLRAHNDRTHKANFEGIRRNDYI